MPSTASRLIAALIGLVLGALIAATLAAVGALSHQTAEPMGSVSAGPIHPVAAATGSRKQRYHPAKKHSKKHGHSTRAITSSRGDFTLFQANVHWGICSGTIPFWVDPTGGPAGFLGDVEQVLDEVAKATGYTFAYAGTTPPAHKIDNYGGLAYSWSRGGILTGFPIAMTTPAIWPNGQITGAQILFDEDEIHSTALLMASIRHETGHAMGLNHIDDPTQIMNPAVGHAPTNYGSGDLAGLKAVGVSAGCFDVASTGNPTADSPSDG